MDNKEFDLMKREETTHWWYRARRRIVDFYLAATVGNRQDCRILDIASACGANWQHYKDYGTLWGIDIAEASIDYCKARGFTNVVKADAHHLPFSDNSFDIVLALDALEHFSDDRQVLAEIYRVLREGGTLIISSPAHALLWSQHDQAFHHHRRYSRRDLVNKVTAAGLSVTYVTYWSFLLFLPVLIMRRGRDLFSSLRKNKEPATSDFSMKIPPFLMTLLDQLARCEAFFIRRRISFPCGVSIFCVARKEQGASACG